MNFVMLYLLIDSQLENRSQYWYLLMRIIKFEKYTLISFLVQFSVSQKERVVYKSKVKLRKLLP